MFMLYTLNIKIDLNFFRKSITSLSSMNYTMLGSTKKINLEKSNIVDIGDLKNYIVNIDKKYLIENLKITYNDNNKKTILTNDKDKVNDDIFYNVSVVPIPCNE